MKFPGTLLMVLGWFIVLGSLALFSGPGLRAVVAAAGVGIEVFGLLLACRKEAQ